MEMWLTKGWEKSTGPSVGLWRGKKLPDSSFLLVSSQLQTPEVCYLGMTRMELSWTHFSQTSLHFWKGLILCIRSPKICLWAALAVISIRYEPCSLQWHRRSLLPHCPSTAKMGISICTMQIDSRLFVWREWTEKRGRSPHLLLSWEQRLLKGPIFFWLTGNPWGNEGRKDIGRLPKSKPSISLPREKQGGPERMEAEMSDLHSAFPFPLNKAESWKIK